MVIHRIFREHRECLFLSTILLFALTKLEFLSYDMQTAEVCRVLQKLVCRLQSRVYFDRFHRIERAKAHRIGNV